MSATQFRSPDPQYLCQYTDAGIALIPLHRAGSVRRVRGAVVKLGKVPRDSNWPNLEYFLPDMRRHMVEGGNVGARLGPEIIFMDVDRRNYRDGVDSLQKLAAEFNIDLRKCPHIITGSGGDHFVFRKPASVPTRKNLTGYPGIDFLSEGSQAVAAGSVHPDTGQLYLIDSGSPAIREAPELPPQLLSALSRLTPASLVKPSAQLAPEDLRRLLSALDVEKYVNAGGILQRVAGAKVQH